MQTNIRSLLGVLSRTLNLINPEMQHHHEQTAYLAYQVAKELGLSDEELFLVLNASLLHDIGEVVVLPASKRERPLRNVSGLPGSVRTCSGISMDFRRWLILLRSTRMPMFRPKT